MLTLSIDPGTKQSAYTLIREDYSIVSAAKSPNEDVLNLIHQGEFDALAVECMEPRFHAPGAGKNMGLRIGDEVYETCIWIGRFMEATYAQGKPVFRVFRSEERARLIPTKKNGLPPLTGKVGESGDSKMRAALIARFARHDKVNGKGRAANKDFFYGFRADMWNAFAVGVVHLDKMREGSA